MSWNGVKKYTNNINIKAWCEEMGIESYTINSKGEIDVDGDVDLSRRYFKELPYKFGVVKGFFNLDGCEKLISLKNCPNETNGYFSCGDCTKLDSLTGCPKEVWSNFYCNFFCKDYKRKFTEEQVRSLCKVKGNIYN